MAPRPGGGTAWRRLAKEALGAALLIGFIALALRVVRTTAVLPWDFLTYGYASLAVQKGLDPYNVETLSRLAHRPVGMPFVYPLVTVPVFMPFLGLRIPQAVSLWLAINVAALAGMLLIWRRRFLPATSVVLLGLAIAFGFNGSSVWSLRTGNVAPLEQLLLWAGFACYGAGRRGLAASAIVLGSVFKLLPVVFLFLLLLPVRDRRPSWAAFGAALACFLALVWGPAVLGHPWAGGFLHAISAERPWSLANPSPLGLIDTLLGSHSGALVSPISINLILWLAYAAAVILISAAPIRRAWTARDPARWVMLGAILFVLLHPRPMAYSYLFAIPSVYFLIAPRLGARGDVIVTVALVVQAAADALIRFRYADPWAPNLPFLVLLVLWVIAALGEAMERSGRSVGPRIYRTAPE